MGVSDAARTDETDGKGSPEPGNQLKVVGPDGCVMTIRDLPPADTKRWVPRRKAMVVYAVEADLIRMKEACDRYDLTPAEFASWKRSVKRYGVRGLRVTRLKQYRESSRPQGMDSKEKQLCSND